MDYIELKMLNIYVNFRGFKIHRRYQNQRRQFKFIFTRIFYKLTGRTERYVLDFVAI